MTSRIVIENDVARIEDIAVRTEMPLADLMPHLETRLATIFPMLPANTRTIGFNPTTKRGIVLVQQPPRRTTIRAHIQYSNDTDARLPVEPEGHTLLSLAFPYMVFAFEFTIGLADEYRGLSDFRLDSWSLYWRNAPINSMQDGLWRARMMNVDDGAYICWGSTHATVDSLHERIDEMVKSFTQTEFNGDLGFNRPNGHRSYSAWQRASEENPLCWTEWREWDTTPQTTVEALMQRAMGNTGVADIGQVRDAIPPPPNVFSVGRALEWMRGLDRPSQRRFLRALNQHIGNLEPETDSEEDADDDPLAEPANTAARPMAGVGTNDR